MTEVVIAGIGQTAVGEHWDISLRELAFYAIEAAQENAGGLRPQALFVGNMLAPTVSSQAHLGALIADFAGLRGIEAYTIEAAGASGGAALRAGYLAIKSGFVDVALIVGVEKCTDKVGGSLEAAIATSLDSDYESIQGLTPVSQAALLMRRYLHEFDLPADALAGFPITSHANGVGNPNAMFRKAIRPSLYGRVGMISDPVNLFDVAPNADGAAAVMLTRPDLLPPGLPHPQVQISASAVATDTLALHDRPDPLDFRAAHISVERACYQAGISIDQVDFFELYDAFSIYAALSLEAAGFAERGRGWLLAREDGISPQGRIPISTMGGLKARGNPWGATGIYQIVESALQLRNEAGDNQIRSAKCALVQSLGGPASTAVTHVLKVVLPTKYANLIVPDSISG
ncbi:MAG: beta-ketoacyl synthase N-terminal-like domain-containing protein [Chloroflexota bacterium]|nr:beta-ketoacyl synthase N-terminal-like domain-containing protein [Chloroflexota bacterium]